MKKISTRSSPEARRSRQATIRQLRHILALALWGSGDRLAARAEAKSGAEADALFNDAMAKYAAALKIKPDRHEVLNNWGNALAKRAETKSGAEADALFNDAAENFAAALKIKPDDHEALNNWGAALDRAGADEIRRRGRSAVQGRGRKIRCRPQDQAQQARGAKQLGRRARGSGRDRNPAPRPTRSSTKRARNLPPPCKFKPDDHDGGSIWAPRSPRGRGRNPAQRPICCSRTRPRISRRRSSSSPTTKRFKESRCARAEAKSGQADALFKEAAEMPRPRIKPSSSLIIGAMRSSRRRGRKPAPRQARYSMPRLRNSPPLSNSSPTITRR